MQLYKFDVLCIGGGGAAITAAVTASKSGLNVALLTKEPLGVSTTKIAMGMVACPELIKGDTAEIFYNDILAGGENLNVKALVQALIESSTEAIKTLESYGHIFLRDESGNVSDKVAIKAGGHRYPRGLSSPPAGGIAISSALKNAAWSSGLSIWEETIVIDLATTNNRIYGVIAYHIPSGEFLVFQAQAVILGTGGCGWLYYPHTDCLRSSTGDGFALALNAGAKLIDMEQIQFIPFGVAYPPAYQGIFIGEPSLAGSQGRLINSHGKVIVSKKINVMTRAEVAQTISLEVKRGNGTENGGLFLDLSPNLESFEGINTRDRLQKAGSLDIIRLAYGQRAFDWLEAWEVVPTVHYIMGGIAVDSWGRTDVHGLYAVGEVQGGIHGGNRLGNVALTDILSFGIRTGKAILQDIHSRDTVREVGLDLLKEKMAIARKLINSHGENKPINLKSKLQAIMNQYVGPVRIRKELLIALTEISSLEKMLDNVSISRNKTYNMDILDLFELRAMLLTAKAITISALEREETRGAHVRIDYPTRSSLLYNVLIQKDFYSNHLQAVRKAVT